MDGNYLALDKKKFLEKTYVISPFDSRILEIRCVRSPKLVLKSVVTHVAN
jgi:hypothetical protein